MASIADARAAISAARYGVNIVFDRRDLPRMMSDFTSGDIVMLSVSSRRISA